MSDYKIDHNGAFPSRVLEESAELRLLDGGQSKTSKTITDLSTLLIEERKYVESHVSPVANLFEQAWDMIKNRTYPQMHKTLSPSSEYLDELPVRLFNAVDGDTYVVLPLRTTGTGKEVSNDLVTKLQAFAREARARLRMGCSEVKDASYLTLKMAGNIDYAEVIGRIVLETKYITEKAKIRLYFIPIDYTPKRLREKTPPTRIQEQNIIQEIEVPYQANNFANFARQRIAELGFKELTAFHREKRMKMHIVAFRKTLTHGGIKGSLPKRGYVISDWANALAVTEKSLRELIKREKIKNNDTI